MRVVGKNIDPTKREGQSGATPMLLKHSLTTSTGADHELLRRIFGAMWDAGSMGTLLQRAFQMSSFKTDRGKDPAEYKSYRPIFIHECLAKAYQRYANNRTMIVLQLRQPTWCRRHASIDAIPFWQLTVPMRPPVLPIVHRPVAIDPRPATRIHRIHQPKQDELVAAKASVVLEHTVVDRADHVDALQMPAPRHEHVPHLRIEDMIRVEPDEYRLLELRALDFRDCQRVARDQRPEFDDEHELMLNDAPAMTMRNALTH